MCIKGLKFQGDRVIGNSRNFMCFTSSNLAIFHNKYWRKIPSCFQKGQPAGKGTILNYARTFCPYEDLPSRKIVSPGSKLLEFVFLSPADLGEGSIQLQPNLAIFCHLRGGWERTEKDLQISQCRGEAQEKTDTSHRSVGHALSPHLTTTPLQAGLLTSHRSVGHALSPHLTTTPLQAGLLTMPPFTKCITSLADKKWGFAAIVHTHVLCANSLWPHGL